ncbi:MAG: PQQ-binding-like beta-propeller repeat protein [Gammaproteobacteria bacterium]|jgi:quinoprotein glucose dehydrogenase|nr:PQQ-binding-like beta-propeller repeat protein [Gammaproteobacteria bacterium]
MSHKEETLVHRHFHFSAVLRRCMLLLLTAASTQLGAQSDSYDWPSQNLNIHNSRYAELEQINRSNVARLAEQWTYSPGPQDDITQVTPLVVDGVMYLHSRLNMFALDARTGEELWRRPLDAGPAGGPVRGSTYADGRVYAYRGADLYAFDASNGEALRSFGDTGVLKVVAEALHHQYPDVYPTNMDPVTIGYRLTTPPSIHDGKMCVAAALSEGHIPGGLVIKIDASSVVVEWVFNTIPQTPSDSGWELASETWGSGQRAGGGVWTPPAIDTVAGLVYVNAGNPSPDYDGSARVGANLFTNATIALDMNSGELAWYFQAVHHDLWDWDHVTGPLLFDVTNDAGELIKGVAAGGKNCLFYLWDRVSGAPLFPMVETTVPTATDVPGEVVYPTQPIPHTARGIPMDPLCATFIEFSDPELAARSRQLYTPYSVTEPYIVSHGGSSFGSASFSPKTELVYITGKNGAISLNVEPLGDSLRPGPGGQGHDENFSVLDRISEDYTPALTVSAYRPADGEQVWQAELPAQSSIGASGNLVTAGNLVFQGIEDGGFYALDAEDGETLFRFQTPRQIRASPLSYAVEGKQYVTVVSTNTVVTLALP